jgi:hypothetical protein
MRALALAALLLTSCTNPSGEPTPTAELPTGSESSGPTATASATAPSQTPEASAAGSATVTFRLTLTGTAPSEATFALQDGDASGSQHAIYLCSSSYPGYPKCVSGGSYDDVWVGPPGTELTYSFWRELDVNGTKEPMQTGTVTAASTEQILSVSYEFKP